MVTVRLGLIGDSIARSQSPRLHVEAGLMCGLDVTYERLIPADLGLAFDEVFDRCVASGFRGINVTYPYKEIVMGRLDRPAADAARIGACNTVLFDDGARGFNTDYSGFVAAWRARFGAGLPGRVAMAGAGGVGKAVAFALATLGAEELAIFDPDRGKAEALAVALKGAAGAMGVRLSATMAEAADGATGLVNGTPLGMEGKPGSAVAAGLMRGASWAFDAVYTPVDTLFLREARQAGVETLSGYELFFNQGIDAFRLFTGVDVDPEALRRTLGNPAARAGG